MHPPGSWDLAIPRQQHEPLESMVRGANDVEAERVVEEHDGGFWIDYATILRPGVVSTDCLLPAGSRELHDTGWCTGKDGTFETTGLNGEE